jgi:hypothetical protein
MTELVFYIYFLKFYVPLTCLRISQEEEHCVDNLYEGQKTDIYNVCRNSVHFTNKLLSNKHVMNVGKYLDIVKNKWFSKVEDM